MIQIQEAIISGYRPLKYGLSISLNIKQEDISKQDRDILEEYWKDGNSLACVLQPFISEKPIERSKASTLHFFMNKYCELHNLQEEVEVQKIYNKYKVNSRSSLSDKDLDFEIESYKAGLLL